MGEDSRQIWRLFLSIYAQSIAVGRRGCRVPGLAYFPRLACRWIARPTSRETTMAM